MPIIFRAWTLSLIFAANPVLLRAVAQFIQAFPFFFADPPPISRSANIGGVPDMGRKWNLIFSVPRQEQEDEYRGVNLLFTSGNIGS